MKKIFALLTVTILLLSACSGSPQSSTERKPKNIISEIKTGSNDTNAVSAVLYKGVSVAQLFGLSPDEVIEVLGYPERMGELYLQYEDAEVDLDENDYSVTGIGGDAGAFTVNGQLLTESPEESVRILGEPDEKFTDVDYNVLAYYTSDYNLSIHVDESNHIAFISFKPPFDTDIPEDNDAYFAESDGYEIWDSSLVGRWRSEDGSALTLESTGIASTYFNFWYSGNLPPEYATWEAYNGRLILNAHRQDEYYWIIGEGKSLEDGVEYATDELSMQSDRPITHAPSIGNWSRVKTSSTDLTGTWRENSILDRALIFNADGIVGTLENKQEMN